MNSIIPFVKPATLSVCVIFGNEGNHIERFIESFKCVADEFVFVRAIGSLAPDDTQEKIEAKCLADGVKYTLADYVNQTEESKAWPHVDRFDLARQMSFDLATGELRMWADCDDVLGETTPVAIAAIKSDPDRYEVYFGVYELPTADHEFFRERIVGRIPVAWRGAVHEAMVLPPKCRHAVHKGVVIVHMPLEKKQPGVDRNLKILEHAYRNPTPDDYMPQTLFYLHRDHYIHPEATKNGYLEKAFDYALKYIDLPNAEMVQKYECLFNLCQMLADEPKFVLKTKQGATAEGSDKTMRERYALNAFRLDPSRREALAQLILLELERNAPKRALAYVNAMRGIPEPTMPPWTHQRPVYAWKGALLHTMALRRTGQEEKARELESHIFHKNGAYFSVLHATRRGKDALKAMYLWLVTAQNAGAVEWIFAVDEDDEKTRKELEGYRVVVVPGESKGPVAAWNLAAANASGHILMQMSDDWTPMVHWDRLIVDRIGDKTKEAVLQVSDGHRKDDLLCMAILTKPYYDRYGYLFHHEYFSMYSDNEFSMQAFRDGVVKKAPDVQFTHNHPLFTGNALDEVYSRSNDPKNYQDGASILEKRKHLFEAPAL